MKSFLVLWRPVFPRWNTINEIKIVDAFSTTATKAAARDHYFEHFTDQIELIAKVHGAGTLEVVETDTYGRRPIMNVDAMEI